MQSSSQHANAALNPRQISPCSGDKPNHLNSVWLLSGIHPQMHTCLVLFHGCYSLIRFFVQLSYPQCLRLHQAPVSGCLITECIHLHYSALAVEACSSTSELCQEVLRNWYISLHSDRELLPPLILVALIKLLGCGFHSYWVLLWWFFLLEVEQWCSQMKTKHLFVFLDYKLSLWMHSKAWVQRINITAK